MGKSKISVESLIEMGDHLLDFLRRDFSNAIRCPEIEFNQTENPNGNLKGLVLTFSFHLDTDRDKLRREIVGIVDDSLLERKEQALEAINQCIMGLRTSLWKKLDAYLAKANFHNGSFSACGQRRYSNNGTGINLTLFVDTIAEMVRVELRGPQ